MFSFAMPVISYANEFYTLIKSWMKFHLKLSLEDLTI